jgi:hypothetical protein
VRKVEILTDGGFSYINFDNARLVDHLTVMLAGEEAEQAVFGHHALPRLHTGSDRERLYVLAAKAGPMGQQELMVARQKAKRLVRAHRFAIIQLAVELQTIVYVEAQGRWDDLDVSISGDQLGALLDVGGSGILRRAAATA